MSELSSASEFRSAMRRKYAAEFALHRAVAELLEEAIAKPRPIVSVVHLAVDMLMTQVYKTHYSVRLMAENGHAEDAAVLTRRLMELGVRAAYIGAAGDATLCAERAGQYLAGLWLSAPVELKQHMTQAAAARWENISSEYGGSLRKSGRGPSFQDMFSAIGRLDSYEDYRYLSAISHGNPEEFILHYSLETVPLRNSVHIPVLLVYASRFYLALASVWEDWFQLIDQQRYRQEVEPLLKASDRDGRRDPDAG